MTPETRPLTLAEEELLQTSSNDPEFLAELLAEIQHNTAVLALEIARRLLSGRPAGEEKENHE